MPPKPGYLERPEWFSSPKGMKMAVINFEKSWGQLVISSNVARVSIIPAGTKRNPRGWYVDWGFLYDEISRIHFTSEELAAAFGLTDEKGKTGLALLSFYGGDSAEQGKYMRWGICLNIPSLPVDYDHDISISIEIDEQMRTCVRQLLGK